MLLGHCKAACLVSLAGRGVGLFVLGLGFMVFGCLFVFFFFLFKLSVQTPVFRFCLYNCVFGRDFYRDFWGVGSNELV